MIQWLMRLFGYELKTKVDDTILEIRTQTELVERETVQIQRRPATGNPWSDAYADRVRYNHGEHP